MRLIVRVSAVEREEYREKTVSVMGVVVYHRCDVVGHSFHGRPAGFTAGSSVDIVEEDTIE